MPQCIHLRDQEDVGISRKTKGELCVTGLNLQELLYCEKKNTPSVLQRSSSGQREPGGETTGSQGPPTVPL